jgi:PKD repeat protein
MKTTDIVSTRVILLLGLILAITRGAPVSAADVKWWGGANVDLAWDVIATRSGGYALTGQYNYQDNYSGKGLLAALDASADTLWTRLYGEIAGTHLYNLAQAPDNGFVAIGQTMIPGNTRGYLVRTDASGNLLWTKHLGDFTYPRALQMMSDGTFFIAGTLVTPSAGYDMFLLHLDADGDTLSSNTYGGPLNDTCDDMVRLQSGEFMLVGRTLVAGKNAGIADYNLDLRPGKSQSKASTYLGYVVCLDAARNVAWQDTLGGPGYVYLPRVADAGDHKAMIFGFQNMAPGNDDALFALADASPSGGVLWTRLNGGPRDEGIWGMCKYSDNLFLAVGCIGDAGSGVYEAWMRLVDRNGDVLFSRSYGGFVSVTEFVGVATDGDSTFVAVGETSEYGAGSNDIYVVRDTVPAMAWFLASPTSGEVPLTVAFTEAATIHAVSWQWDLDGDGDIDSYERNPIYEYQSAGAYDVTLHVSDGSQTVSYTRENFVRAGCPLLDAEPMTLDLTCAAGDTAVDLLAPCGSPLNWDVSSDAPWLQVSKSPYFQDSFDHPIASWDVRSGEWDVTPSGKLLCTEMGYVLAEVAPVRDCSVAVTVENVIPEDTYTIALRSNGQDDDRIELSINTAQISFWVWGSAPPYRGSATCSLAGC